MARIKFVILVLCFLVVDSIGSARALENVSTEVWTGPHGFFYGDDNNSIDILFDAHFGEADLASGFTYSVVERDANGNPSRNLFEVVLEGLENLPPVGTPVKVNVEFHAMCNEEGRFVVSNVTTFMSYCHPEFGTLYQFRAGVGSGQINVSQSTESFSLALMDENQHLGPNPPPMGDFWCTDLADVSRSGAPISTHAYSEDSFLADEHASIGIYFDEAGTQCAGSIPAGEPTTVYVLAKLAGETECGISGAEFRFGGIPAGWIAVATPYPNVVAFGDPFADGTAAGFPCNRPDDMLIPLFQVLVLADETTTDHQFTIEQRLPPTNPSEPRPFLVLCDAPVFSKTQVRGIPCWVNPSAVKDCSLLVAVQVGTWSEVKSLYR